MNLFTNKQKLLSFLFLVSLMYSFAQEPLKKIDSMLIAIDKTTLNTDILYDRVTPLAQLDVFNDSINISSKGHFEQTLFELYRASNKQKFVYYRDLRDLYTPKSQKNAVDIGIINASFNQVNFKTDQANSALKITNDKFEKINNTKPAFTKKQTLVIAALKNKVYGNDISYKFNNSFIFQYGKQIKTLTANFDTQADYTIINNGILTNNNIIVHYNDAGTKTLTFVVTFTDNTVMATSAFMDVFSPQDVLDNIIEDATIIADEAFNGVNGVIEYRTFYRTKNDNGSNNDQATLIKPIVIIDGYDPGDNRSIGLLTDNINDNTLINQMYYKDQNDETKNLVTKLREDGYDVIIVNQKTYTASNGDKIDGGADYIERNAMAHIKLYQTLNIKLATSGSTNKLVIMGPSMGGLISRYALAYMEKKYDLETDPIIKETWQHNTRLWVSMDSPHLGANIPMGVQSLLYTLKNVAGSAAAADFVDYELNSNAAKEMLIEQYKQKYVTYTYPEPGNLSNTITVTSTASSGNLLTEYLDAKTISQGFSEDRGRPEFISFYNRLNSNGITNSKGFPQNLRKIAIVNGSLTGSKLFKNFWETNSLDERTPPIIENYSGDGSQTIKIKGFERNFWNMHLVTMEAYSMPSSNSYHKISYFKKKKAFGWKYTNTYITNVNSRGNLDNVSGGWFKSLNDVVREITGVHQYTNIIGAGPSNRWVYFGISVNKWNIHKLKHVAAFIPTVSALAFSNPNFNWNTPVGDRNLSCTNEIPFDNYYGEEINTAHTSLTQNSVNWLFSELNTDSINGPFPTPSVYLNNNNDLKGSSTICYGSEETFFFNDCKITGNVSWSWSTSSLQLVSSTNTSLTVTPTSEMPLHFWVEASVNGTTLRKEISGRPDVDIETIEITYPALIRLTGVSSNDIVNWFNESGTATLTTYHASAHVTGTGNVRGRVEITNECGTTTLRFNINATDPCDGLIITALGSNQYEVGIPGGCDNANNQTYLNSVKLYNIYGEEQLQGLQFQGNGIQLNNTNQSGEIKIIRALTTDGKVKTKTVVVD